MTREQALNYLKSSGFSDDQVDTIVKAFESTTKNDLGVDCNNCKNNFHRGDGTSYCATGDGMCHYECEEPTTKNDLGVDAVSRADIIDRCKYVIEHGKPRNGQHSISVENLLAVVQTMPSVMPIRPKGHWVTKTYVYGVVFCSECGFELRIDNTNYCPNCGADMREVVEE